MLATDEVFDEDVRRLERQRRHPRRVSRSRQQGDRAAVAVPEEHGAIDAGGVEHAGQRPRGFAVHEVDRQTVTTRIGVAVAAAAVGEHRAAGAGGQRGREIAPGGDAAQALVEQDDGRLGRAGSAGATSGFRAARRRRRERHVSG